MAALNRVRCKRLFDSGTEEFIEMRHATLLSIADHLELLCSDNMRCGYHRGCANYGLRQWPHNQPGPWDNADLNILSSLTRFSAYSRISQFPREAFHRRYERHSRSRRIYSHPDRGNILQLLFPPVQLRRRNYQPSQE